MSDTNFDSSESNWSEFPRENSWDENQWRKYLKDSDDVIENFLSVYDAHKGKPNHFDKIAAEMGWDIQDISMTDEFEFEESEVEVEDEVNDDDLEPYTPLSHPVIVVTHALYGSLRKIWEDYINEDDSTASPQLCWRYADSLHQAEMNVVLAVHAIDLGDYGLTICHLKNSLSALNSSLSIVNNIVHTDAEFSERIREEIRLRLFDLRELWLRVMDDCRTEYNRHKGTDRN